MALPRQRGVQSKVSHPKVQAKHISCLANTSVHPYGSRAHTRRPRHARKCDAVSFRPFDLLFVLITPSEGKALA